MYKFFVFFSFAFGIARAIISAAEQKAIVLRVHESIKKNFNASCAFTYPTDTKYTSGVGCGSYFNVQLDEKGNVIFFRLEKNSVSSIPAEFSKLLSLTALFERF